LPNWRTISRPMHVFEPAIKATSLLKEDCSLQTLTA
jgi:hypothetical protein